MSTNHENTPIKHTPGPWKADPSTGDVTSAADDDIAFVYSTKRDLSLIAAAPELLEALKRVSKYAANGFTFCPGCNQVEEAGHAMGCYIGVAIAKAEGKE